MEWKEPRIILNATKVIFTHSHSKPKLTDQERNKLLKMHNYSCRSCGGTYKSHLISTYIIQEDCHDVYCSACHAITHLNNGIPKSIDIYYSTLSQLDIVKKTVNYVIVNGFIPLPTEIDPQVELSPISLFEYVNLLDHIDDTTFKNYKIFFNKDFGINFITKNYNDESLFVEDDDENNENCQDEESKVNPIILNTHTLCEKECDVLKELFTK